MWARIVEMVLACWLLASPLVFDHPAGERLSRWSDLGSGALVLVFALLSWRRKSRHAHLMSAAVALWLIGLGYLGSPYPAPPALQNDIVVGLLLLTFAIVPSEASRPPAAWRGFPEAERLEAGGPR